MINVVGIHAFKTQLHKFFRKPSARAISLPLPIAQRLPVLLAPGEEWVGMYRQDKLLELDEFKSVRFIYFGVEDNQSTKPKFARLHQ